MKAVVQAGLHAGLSLAFLVFFVLGGLGLWYRLPFGPLLLAIVLLCWVMLALVVIGGEWTSQDGKTRLVGLVFFALMALWWSSIRPSSDRDWRPELARTVEGRIAGNRAYLRNIRNFSWQTSDQGIARWLDASYDLDTITGMSMYLSYWMGPWVAHTLVGFHFADGRELVFSSEIRRTNQQKFSTIGGFFKEFELAVIAALPQDIIRLRTDVRRENVFRYPLRVSPGQARTLFKLYIDTANQLARRPEFYNTLTTNCTTIIFGMVRLADPAMRPDWRILLSGKLPAYLYAHRVIDTSLPLRDVVKKAYITAGRPVPANLLP